MQISPMATLVASKPASVEVVSSEGEVLMRLPLGAGRTLARDLLQLTPPGAELEPGDGVMVIEPPSLSAVVTGNGYLDADANPDFKPTPVTALAAQLRAVVQAVQEKSNALEARQRHLEKALAMPVGREAEKANARATGQPEADPKEDDPVS